MCTYVLTLNHFTANVSFFKGGPNFDGLAVTKGNDNGKKGFLNDK